MRNRFVIVVAMLVAILAPGYALAQGELSQEDVDGALERRREASSALEQMTLRFTEAMADEELLRERISELARSVSELEQEIGVRRVQVRELVKERYMAGGSLGTERVFTARTFSDIPVQTQYFAVINDADLVVLNGLQAAEALHVEQQAELDRSLDDQEVVVAELTVLAEELGAALANADEEYESVAAAFQKQEEERKRREEEERKRREAEEQRRRESAATAATSTTTTPGSAPTTQPPDDTTSTTAGTQETTTTTPPETTTTTTPPPPPPVTTDGRTCPVNAANSFSDTWGAPRSGGRTHKGVDMVAARNAPLVAIESGTVTRTSNSALGGRSVYLTGSSGSRYYYAHLEYFADGIRSGTSVSVGQILGGNGSSGNAPDWLPHLHCQYAPPGSDWVNPYPLVKALCG